MFSIASTYILYNSLLIICPLLCYIAEKKNQIFMRYFAYFILMFVAATRFDIGADYETYYEIFTDIADTLQNFEFSWMDLTHEPITYIITYLFLWAPDPSICAFGFYSVLSIYFFYKIFDYYNIHTIGIAAYIITFAYFQMWDWVRQGLALAIFMYSLRFVKEEKSGKFLLCVLFATLTHYSALLTIFVYPLRNIQIRPQILGVIVFIFIIIAQTGLFAGLQQLLFGIIPYYSEIYGNTMYATQGGSSYTSNIYLLTMLCYTLMLLITPREYSFYGMLVFIGAMVYGFSGGNLAIDRIASYYTTVQTILIALLYRNSVTSKSKLIITGIFFLYLIALNRVYIYAEFRGVTPYESIFSHEYDILYFRERVDTF